MISKTLVVSTLLEKLKDQKKILIQGIDMAVESANSDSKSSAGDKYETGREMAQQEVSKMQGQLALVEKNLSALNQINVDTSYESVQFGALVQTDLRHFFVSISHGELKVSHNTILAISAASPIGQLMLGKKSGEEFAFLGKQEKILKVT